MTKGSIILIPFPFSDLSGSKKRPAVVLFANDLVLIVVFISTQMQYAEPLDILIAPALENGLKKLSYIKVNKISTLDRRLAIGRLGNLSNQDLAILDNNLKVLLAL